jgi:hypothetical protein
VHEHDCDFLASCHNAPQRTGTRTVVRSLVVRTAHFASTQSSKSLWMMWDALSLDVLSLAVRFRVVDLLIGEGEAEALVPRTCATPIPAGVHRRKGTR